MDIDGTLLDSRAALREENARAIAEAAARGIEIVLVTGRRFDFARHVSDALPCDLHLIVNNGSLIKSKTGETHQRLLLPSARLFVCSNRRSNFARPRRWFSIDRAKQVVLERVDWDDPHPRELSSAQSPAHRRNVAAHAHCLNGEDPVQVGYVGHLRDHARRKKRPGRTSDSSGVHAGDDRIRRPRSLDPGRAAARASPKVSPSPNGHAAGASSARK